MDFAFIFGCITLNFVYIIYSNFWTVKLSLDLNENEKHLIPISCLQQIDSRLNPTLPSAAKEIPPIIIDQKGNNQFLKE
ncbi:hypothetical protein ACA30_04185 [Virgibacillus soli]|nr:hypothetical protein ACA30_04185 [Virgibacillus soli]